MTIDPTKYDPVSCWECGLKKPDVKWHTCPENDSYSAYLCAPCWAAIDARVKRQRAEDDAYWQAHKDEEIEL